MNFFRGIFNPIRTESVVLIDIGIDSVAGAHAHFKEGETPVLLYARRVPISIREGEQSESAMLRAFEELGSLLISEGAPILARVTGSGKSDAILVSVDSFWQQTSVRTEQFERQDAFVFTEHMASEALQKSRVVPNGKISTDESIIGAILNGYETRNPYGKKTHRANLIVLASIMNESITKNMASVLRKLYHTDHTMLISGSSLRYQAMRMIFPHEGNALFVDGMGAITSIALVHNDLFSVLAEMPNDNVSDDEWAQKITEEFTKLKEQYPLPRTVFLLTSETKTASLQKLLNTSNLNALWFSNNPPKIIQISVDTIAGFVRQTTPSLPDLRLLFMTLFWQRNSFEKK